MSGPPVEAPHVQSSLLLRGRPKHREVMDGPLVRKLSGFVELSRRDALELEALCRPAQRLPARTRLIEEGERPQDLFLLLEGWACRLKILPNGSRQILGYLIPGDVCGIHAYILQQMDHAIDLLSVGRVVRIPPERMQAVLNDRPAVRRAFEWSTLVDIAVLRQWLISASRRSAQARMAHFFLEMWLRMRQVGLAEDGQFSFPLTQVYLGDTLGLTPIHVNRTLQQMRAEGIVSFARKRMTILDPDRLAELAQFEPGYLHIQREV